MTNRQRRAAYYLRLERYKRDYPNRWHQLDLWRRYQGALKNVRTRV